MLNIAKCSGSSRLRQFALLLNPSSSREIRPGIVPCSWATAWPLSV